MKTRIVNEQQSENHIKEKREAKKCEYDRRMIEMVQISKEKSLRFAYVCDRMYRPNVECCVLFVVLLPFDNGAGALADGMRKLKMDLKV